MQSYDDQRQKALPDNELQRLNQQALTRSKFAQLVDAVVLFGGRRVGSNAALERFYADAEKAAKDTPEGEVGEASARAAVLLTGLLQKILAEIGTTPKSLSEITKATLPKLHLNTALLETYHVDYCDHCGHDASAERTLKACKTCELAYYCSRACQAAAWPAHAARCEYFALGTLGAM